MFVSQAWSKFSLTLFFATGESPAVGDDAFAKRSGSGPEPTLWWVKFLTVQWQDFTGKLSE